MFHINSVFKISKNILHTDFYLLDASIGNTIWQVQKKGRVQTPWNPDFDARLL